LLNIWPLESNRRSIGIFYLDRMLTDRALQEFKGLQLLYFLIGIILEYLIKGVMFLLSVLSRNWLS